MSFPLSAFGIDFRRNVTLLRLTDKRVVIHFSAPFTGEDITAIRRFGEPAWLVDVTLMHDTFAREGRGALSGLPYLAPRGFAKASGVTVQPLVPPPSAWVSEIDVMELNGTKKNEHALYHRRSRTLVVADLFFSFPPETRGWLVFCASRDAPAFTALWCERFFPFHD